MSGVVRIAANDPRFPTALLVAYQPPVQIWVEGDLALLERPSIGVIGTRTPTRYGLGATHDAARELAGQGLVIVSGMAPGLDARAHQGALEAGGGTIAVLGCGIDVPYPRPNLGLLRQVKERGLVITEFAPGIGPRESTFPKRNRLIAALSQALLVMEGAIRSGTSNTVKWMSALGRPILAAPGRIGDPMSAGPNNLIRDGAHPYLHPNDVLRVLGMPLLPEEDGPEPVDDTPPELPRAEATVFDLVSRKPVHVDVLASRCELEPGLLLAALSSLEMRGLIAQHPGKLFALAS